MDIDGQSTTAKFTPTGWSSSAKIQILALGSMLLFSVPRPSLGADKGVVPVDGGELLGGASKVSAGSAQDLVALSKAGQGVKFAGVPAGATLAIRYASVGVGTISVAVNGGPARR